MKITVASVTRFIAATQAWSLDYYCPENLAHPVHYSSKNNRACTAFSPAGRGCKVGDLLNWDKTFIADAGCTLRFYSGSPCRANQEIAHWGSDKYQNINFNAPYWGVTGC